MFTLYTTPLSANGRKVMAASHHLKLQPEVKLINVYKGEGRTPEYLAVNPWGKIPTLVDGELTLWESNAILQYLSEAYGDYKLWSQDPKRRADISRWLFWESAHWQPAFQSLLRAVGRTAYSGLVHRQVSDDIGDARDYVKDAGRLEFPNLTITSWSRRPSAGSTGSKTS